MGSSTLHLRKKNAPGHITGRWADGFRTREVAPDVAYLRTAIVNVVLLGKPDGPWLLVDAGLPGSSGTILAACRARFGNRPPSAIVLTHGHFDHVGALPTLLRNWKVPLYAHARELPYLTGQTMYPPPDARAGGGLMSLASVLYPRGPFDFRPHLQPLGSHLPALEGWSVIETPGHSAGHVSFWRADDRLLVAGDAVITTKQESVYGAFVEPVQLRGPPAYFTPDWQAAWQSVQTIAGLKPHTLVPGHGRALAGPGLGTALQALAGAFDRLSVPPHRLPGSPGRPRVDATQTAR